MVEKSEKHFKQQDVSTKEKEPLTDLEYARLDLLEKIDLVSGKRDEVNDKIFMLEMELEIIEEELSETCEFLSEKILKKHMRPELLNRLRDSARDMDF